MIARLKLWAAAVGFVVAALLASWLGGRKSAQTDAKADRLDAANRAKEIENEVEALGNDDLKRRAAVWVRGADR
jgi:hypothetical protein